MINNLLKIDLNEILKLIHKNSNGPLFIFVLLGTGLFFTIYLKFPQVRFFLKAMKMLFRPNKKNDKTGDTSPFQTIATSLGGSIGVGSISGVGLAIHIGGPASLFWMVITAFLSMAINFVEVIICHQYREKADDGTMTGGPMYYMKNRLNMKYLAIIFAILTILSAFGAGNLTQANSIAKAMFFSFNINKLVSGICISAIIGFIILGGIKRIGAVAEKLIPFMSIIYLMISILVLIKNASNVIPSLKIIFQNVFNSSSAIGGFVGGSFALAVNVGVNRSYFCSGAGSGAIGITHAASTEKSPFKEALLASLEPFISTIIMCMFTGLVILSTNLWQKKTYQEFDYIDTKVIAGNYKENNEKNLKIISDHILNKHRLKMFNGNLIIENGKITNGDITIINSRSIAENITLKNKKSLFTGTIKVNNGIITKDENISIYGKSILKGIDLANLSFEQSILKKWGSIIMTICLVLFAFTTIMAYYYFGNRAIVFLGFSNKVILLYKVAFVFILLIGSITEATKVWLLSDIAYAIMAIPNLIGLFFLRSEIKKMMQNEV